MKRLLPLVVIFAAASAAIAAPKPKITSPTTSSGTIGVPYSYQITADGYGACCECSYSRHSSGYRCKSCARRRDIEPANIHYQQPGADHKFNQSNLRYSRRRAIHVDRERHEFRFYVHGEVEWKYAS